MTRRFKISSAFIVVTGCLAPESSIGTPIESEAMETTNVTTGQTQGPAPDDTGNASKTSTSEATTAGSAPGDTGDASQTSTSGGTSAGQEVSCDGHDQGEPNNGPSEAECLDSRLEARTRTLCPHDDVDVYRIEIPDDGSDPTGGEAAFLEVDLVLPGSEDHLSAISVVLYDETLQVLTSGNGGAHVPELGPGVYFVELSFGAGVPANVERMEYGVVADVN